MERKIKETSKKPDSVTKDQIKAAVSAVASNLVCSFCEKDKDDVMYLIAGKSGYICNECVMLCMDILSDRIRGRI